MAESNPETREFIRHTADVPIEYTPVDGGAGSARARSHDGHSFNVGHGGLAFETDVCPAVGDVIELRIPTTHPPFVARARVVWCREQNGRHMIGAEFLEESDAFRSRMVQQVCAIEKYRSDVLRDEGRELSREQASAEWVEKFAGRFPTVDGQRDADAGD